MLTIKTVEPINACKKCPVAQPSPINTTQKINATSRVSLIVVLKQTNDKISIIHNPTLVSLIISKNTVIVKAIITNVTLNFIIIIVL